VGELKSAGKPFDISKAGGVGGIPEGEGQQGRRGCGWLLGLRISSLISRRICSRSGTGCPRAATSRRRCGRCLYRSRMAAGSGFLGVPTVADRNRADRGGRETGGQGRADLPSGLVRLTGLVARLWTRWRHAGGAAGSTTGSWIWTSRSFFDSVDHGLVVKAGGGAHRPAVGAAVCQTVAASADTATRRHLAAAGPGHPPGLLGIARAGEPVPPLRLRHVDGPAVPGRPVREVRGRRGWCTASAKTRPAACGRADREQDGTGRAAAAPRQDQNRVLQGQQTDGSTMSTRRLPSWGTPFRPREARSRTGAKFTSFFARDQQGRPEEDQR